MEGLDLTGFSEVVTVVTGVVSDVLPYGITLLGLSLGISWIPKIIKKFR